MSFRADIQPTGNAGEPSEASTIPSLDRTFTEPQLARLVGLRRAAVREWRKQGLPSFRQRLGNRPAQCWQVLFDREAVLNWLRQTGRRKHLVAFCRALGIEPNRGGLSEAPQVAQPAVEREIMTPEEAAGFLGVRLRTLRAWRLEKGLPYVLLGRRTLRFRRSQLLAWLDGRSVQAAPFRH